MIRMAHPDIPPEALTLLRDVLDSGRLTSGPLVERLEERLSRRLGGAHVVLTSSGTTAALIAFRIMAEHSGGRWPPSLFMPDFCFPSMASAALQTGFDVTLADIDPERLTLDPDRLPRRMPESSLLLFVDQFGIPAPAGRLCAEARSRGWHTFEDAACALASSDDSTPCATLADISILSFHPRKPLTTAEGGAVVTRDPRAAAEARTLRSLGMEGTGTSRHFRTAGYNARMSELHAAVGLAQEEILDGIIERRRSLATRYLELLDKVPAITVPAGYRLPGSNFQCLAVLLPERRREGPDRERTIERLANAGIETALPGFAIHRQPAFRHLRRHGPLPLSSALADRGLALPIHERMTEGDVDLVVDTLARIVA